MVDAKGAKFSKLLTIPDKLGLLLYLSHKQNHKKIREISFLFYLLPSYALIQYPTC